MAHSNPFQKAQDKPTQVAVSLSGEQREIVEALRNHLGLRSNSAVVMEGLALLYDRNRRQIDKAAADGASVETTDAADAPDVS